MSEATKVALITGGARRIGAAIATRLHNAGFIVVIHCHKSQESANLLASKLNHMRPNSAYVLSCDLLDPKSCQNLIQNTVNLSNRLDLLVNNASIFSSSEADWDKLFNTNVKAPYLLSKASSSYLNKTKGSIINITDTHADNPLKGYSIYCQTKAALTLQTKAFAKEFAPNIRVNAIAPGAIAWPENENKLDLARKEKIINKTLLKSHGDPLFIAEAVLALFNNPFITGQILNVDGGRLS